jgi:acyl dehydratase
VFYDDIELGTTVRVGSYRLWDPLPVHIDEAAARRTLFGGLTASGSHTLAIRTLLLHRVPIQDGVIAAGGWDEV